jgi:rRNA processing protein Krr1/Pno1
MTTELSKMKKEKSYLDELIREKTEAVREYDRIIGESERTLQKLSESTKKLLLSVEHQTSKLLQK